MFSSDVKIFFILFLGTLENCMLALSPSSCAADNPRRGLCSRGRRRARGKFSENSLRSGRRARPDESHCQGYRRLKVHNGTIVRVRHTKGGVNGLIKSSASFKFNLLVLKFFLGYIFCFFLLLVSSKIVFLAH